MILDLWLFPKAEIFRLCQIKNKILIYFKQKWEDYCRNDFYFHFQNSYSSYQNYNNLIIKDKLAQDMNFFQLFSLKSKIILKLTSNVLECCYLNFKFRVKLNKVNYEIFSVYLFFYFLYKNKVNQSAHFFFCLDWNFWTLDSKKN